MNRWGRTTAAVLCIAAFATETATAQHEHHHPAPRAAPVEAPAGPVTTLAELESLVLDNHPALAAAAAAERGGRGARLQAGLWPNPTLGVAGEDISLESGREDTARYGFFVEQELVLGGKLAKGRKAAEARVVELEAQAERTRLAALTAVRVGYARAATAQRLLAARTRLSRLADEAVEIAWQLYNTGVADESDLTAAEIEAELVALAEETTRTELTAALASLAAAAGEPRRQIARVSEDLAPLPGLDEATVRARVLRDSPERAGALARLAVAEADLAAVRARAVPNLEITAGALQGRERVVREGPRVGWEGFFEIGVPLPLFDRGQGSIAEAEAAAARARAEVTVLEGGLERRFADVWAEYSSAHRMVSVYREGILPRAEQAYRAYLERYQAMMAAYPQVLMAQRTWFQAEADHLAALGRLHEAAARLEGLLVPLDGGATGEE